MPKRRSPFAIVAIGLAWWTVTLWLVSRVPQVEAAGVALTIATLRGVFRLAGLPTTLVGHVLSVRGTGFEIAPDCSPHLPFLVFAGGVLAAPATWRQRAVGLALGAALLYLFNTLRILALYGIQAWNAPWFEFAHVFLWQVGTILAVLAAFVAWLEWTARPRRAAA